MRYKVHVTQESSADIFYVENERKAELLFNMAKSCGMFDYVALSKVIDEDFLVREWEESYA